MTIAIENAGADRGLLILPSGDEYLIQAEARATGDQIEVTMRQEPITRITCPESLVRYVIRTRESVILDDASKPNLFSADDYLRDRQSKSILCLPLIKQRQLTGILLLENALTSHAFTPARIAVLELMAAQAAISLENTRLYSDLQEREAKVRRLVDSNIIGILLSISTVASWRPTTRFSDGGIRARGSRLGSHALDGPDASGMAREDARRVGGGEIDGNLAAIRERIFPERWQPRAGAGRRGALRGTPGSQAVAFVDRPDRAKARRGRAGAREPCRDNGPTHGLHCPRSQPTYRCRC